MGRGGFLWSALLLALGLTALGIFYGVRMGERIPVAPARTVSGGDPSAGREAAVRYGCGGCHVIAGIPGARGRVGPPLSRVWERSYLAGQLPNEPETMTRWIRDPQALVPGTVMPNLGVSHDDARDIAAYLYSLEGRVWWGRPNRAWGL